MVIRVYNKAYLYHFSVRIRHLQVLAIVFRRYRLLLLARIISLLSGTTGTRLWVSKKCSRPLGQTRSSVVGVTVFPFQQEERMVVLQNKKSKVCSAKQPFILLIEKAGNIEKETPIL